MQITKTDLKRGENVYQQEYLDDKENILIIWCFECKQRDKMQNITNIGEPYESSLQDLSKHRRVKF